MVYKRYIQKEGKIYGPYSYKSIKKDGKVISEYLGKKSSVNNFSNKFLIFAGIFLISFFSILILFLIHPNLTGKAVLSIEDAYQTGDLTIQTIQYSAVLNKPVKWTKQIKSNESTNISIEIPKQAENIRIYKIVDEEIGELEEVNEVLGTEKEQIINESKNKVKITGKIVGISDESSFDGFFKKIFSFMTGRVIEVQEKEDIKEIIIEENATEFEIEYETPGPVAVENKTENGKKIVISSEVHYENILAYTKLSREVPENAVKLYHLINDTKIQVEINKYDLNNNSLIDYVEWIVPSLSEQSYLLVIEVIKAEHLDENRIFISDIYDYVKKRDGNWSETINNNEYVRVSFEKNLTSKRDITIYARSSNISAIEVYLKDSDILITKFENISEENWFKVYLTNLNDNYGVFDLKVIGSVEFDYIVDPISRIFWNKLGSDAQVDTSEIGPNGVRSGTVAYGAGKFDNGVSHFNGANYVTFPNVSTIDLFTADLWWKPDVNSSTAVYHDIINNGPAPDPIDSWGFYAFAYANTIQVSIEIVGTFTYYSFPISYTAGDLVHLGIVMNKSAPNGQRMRLFKDNVEISPSLINNDVTWTSALPKRNFALSLVWGEAQGVVDDVVIWDGVKTDFSDRNYEGRVASDTTPPNVTINSPLNQTYNTNTITFNVTALDETGMSNCSYSLNNGLTNYTMKNSSTSINDYNATNSTMSQGSHTTSFYCRDINNNLNMTENITFFIDSIKPDINITSPINNTNTSDNTLDILYTRSDSTGIESCWYSNDTYLVNKSLGSGGVCVNITNLTWSEGLHNVTVWVNDSVNNVNKSSISFRIDTTNPDINITSPINNTNTTDIGLDILYTRSDSTGIESCWYSNDTYLVNKSLGSGGVCVNITNLTWSDALHNVTIWVNDSLNNLNFSSISFRVDTTQPTISIVFPTLNNTNNSNVNLNINYTASDSGSGLFNFWYNNDTYSVANKSLGVLGTSFNITNITWSEAKHNVTVYVNDSAGNYNFASISFTIDSVNPGLTILIPSVNNTNTTNVNQNVNFTFSDITGIDSVWYNNDTTSVANKSLGSNGIYFNITNITWSEAKHNVTVYVNDSAGNLNYTSVSFRIDTTNPDINITSPINNTNTTNNNLDVNYTTSDLGIGLGNCWYSNDTYLVNITLTNCSTNLTDIIWSEGLHNVTVWVNDSVNNVNKSSISFRIDTTPPQVTVISPTAATYTSSAISFEVSTNENSTCNYTLNSGVTNTSMTANSSNTGFTASQTLSNAAYTSQFYCWDVLNNFNNTEDIAFTVSVSSDNGGSSGGGGGGGGGITPAPIKFSLNPETYERTIVLNKIELGEITITNEESTEKSFNIKVETLKEIILFEETKIKLTPGETKKLELRIYAPKETGIYTGKILVSSGSTTKEILVTINVKTEKNLFDILLSIPKNMKIIGLGRNLNVQIDLTQMGIKEDMDVTLNYVIKDFSGKVYLTESETLAVYDQKSLAKEFYTKEFLPGDYVLGIELVYPEGVAVASSQFKINEKFKVKKKELVMLALILAMVFVFILITIIIKRYKRMLKHIKK